jgi:hypothetical protein
MVKRIRRRPRMRISELGEGAKSLSLFCRLHESVLRMRGMKLSAFGEGKE